MVFLYFSRKNDIADYEGYYCSIVYCYFIALGLNVIPEDTTNNGRIDMTVLFENRVYIIEFKVNELTQSGRALEQINSFTTINYTVKDKDLTPILDLIVDQEESRVDLTPFAT